MNNSGLSYNSPGTVSGVFFTKRDADRAYHALLRRGHTHDDISVLMSDETLNKYERPHPENAQEFVTSGDENKIETFAEAPKGILVKAIISITSMINVPGLGVAISNTFLKKIFRLTTDEASEKITQSSNSGFGLPEGDTDPYGNNMKEGGIIISVDPRNIQEKKAIVKDFRDNNGQDILGDDGYTELG